MPPSCLSFLDFMTSGTWGINLMGIMLDTRGDVASVKQFHHLKGMR